MKKLKIYVCLAILFSTNCFAELQFNSAESSNPKLAHYLEEVKSLLPERIKNDLSKNQVNIKFNNLPENVLGETNHNTIILSSKIKDAILAQKDKSINRAHLTAYTEAIATLLHELTHVWDNANFHKEEEQNLINDCSDDTNVTKSRCIPYANIKYSLSQNPRFLYLSGWLRNVGTFNSTTGLIHRTPDRYEEKDPNEFLAVNMEYFLLDQNYQCRRPLLYQFFKEEFSHTPFKDQDCEKNLSYLSSNPESQKLELKKIDLGRLYQIHYFMAGAGSEVMSRFGHSMIRLVMCAPGTPMGPKCLEDLSYHIVLSYRAMITTMHINNIAGLTGKYPSRLFFQNLQDVIDEYTKGEMRDLYSVPLRVSRSEMYNIVLRALEVHWSYEGKYFFISNNCAIETANLLRSGMNEARLNDMTVHTPNGLFDSLVKINRVEKSYLQNRSEAIRTGYIFDSYLGRYSIALNNLRNYIPSNKIEQYFKLSALKRKEIFELATNKKLTHAQLASFLLLENGALRNARAQLFQSIGQKMLDIENSKDEKEIEMRHQVETYNSLNMFTSSPWKLFDNSFTYGIPTDAEIEIVEKSIAKEVERLQTITPAELQQNLENIVDSKVLTEFQESVENLNKIVSEFKK